MGSPLSSLLPTPRLKPLPPIKHMPSAEMQIRHDKGLCFTCDEKYSWTNKCPNKNIMLLLYDVDDDDCQPISHVLTPNPPNPEDDPPLSLHHLSLQAYQGFPSSATIHFQGTIIGTTVKVLMDGGSSDSFIHLRIAHHLHLPIESTPGVRVLVGNGHYLQVGDIIRALPLQISGHIIHFPTYVLLIFDTNVLIRASWLVTLGEHIADYRSAYIRFYANNAFITLQGDHYYHLVTAKFHHLKRLCATKAIAEMYTLSCFSMDLDTGESLDFPPKLPNDLVVVLQKFSSLFEVPRGLPPPHSHDHSIPLQEGVSAVKVRPYRYHFSHKSEIERMVTVMLQDGLIQPSTGPFLVPILLVHKKDGT